MADEVGFRSWGLRWAAIVVTGVLILASIAASAHETLQQDDSATQHYMSRMLNFLWQKGRLGYEHVWPVSLDFLSLRDQFFLFNIS